MSGSTAIGQDLDEISFEPHWWRDDTKEVVHLPQTYDESLAFLKQMLNEESYKDLKEADSPDGIPPELIGSTARVLPNHKLMNWFIERGIGNPEVLAEVSLVGLWNTEHEKNASFEASLERAGYR